MAQRYLVRMMSILTFIAACVISSANSKSSRQKSRFISFDSSSGKIDIDLDLSVPFLSIPLDEKKDGGQMQTPFVNINTKALGVFGALMAITTFIVPLFVKKLPGPLLKPLNQHYRSDLDFGFSEYFPDEILSKDGRVVPCLQSIICSAVVTATASNKPTNVDKIIDGISRWFDQAVNATVLKEAIATGREVTELEECITKYNKCALDQKIISTLLNIVNV